MNHYDWIHDNEHQSTNEWLTALTQAVEKTYHIRKLVSLCICTCVHVCVHV